MAYPSVAVILLNYNQIENMRACIASLHTVSYPNVRIVIIDNCSPDGSWSILAQEYPELLRYQTDKNTGYAGGINFGVEKARELHPDYILVLNPDTILTETFLGTLVAAMELDAGAAAAGGLVVAEHDRDTIWYAGGKMVPWRGLAAHFKKGRSVKRYHASGARPVNFLTGCMLLIRTSAIGEAGLMNEDFFLYLEDIELSARFTRMGFRLLYVPDAMIYHKVLGEEEDVLKLYYSTRNRLLLIRCMNQGIMRTIAQVYFLGVITGKLAVWSLVKRRFFRAASKGLTDCLRNNFYEGQGLKYFYQRQ